MKTILMEFSPQVQWPIIDQRLYCASTLAKVAWFDIESGFPCGIRQ